jgi:hypothetical protein
MCKSHGLAAFLLAPTLAWALPGDLLDSISPQLRQPIRKAQACLDANGAVHLWANFHTLDGQETGGVIKLAANGSTAAILAPDLLPQTSEQLGLLSLNASSQSRLWCLEDGRFMISGPGLGGALVTPAGLASSGFFHNMPAGIRAEPQFERGGSIYFVITQADGTRMLGRQALATTAWSPEILPSTGWPLQPIAAIPGPGDTIRVLGSATGDDMMSFFIEQRVFLIDPAGQLVPGAAVFDPALNRPASLSVTPGGGYRLIFSGDPTWWMYWPSSFTSSYRVEWRSEDNALLRAMDFPTPGPAFVVAEEPGGKVLATGTDGQLHRFSAPDTTDPSFTSPGYVSSILPLTNGNWLLDGTRRILADGHDDPSWQVPNLEGPAHLTQVLPTPDGGVLAVGDFHQLNGAPVSNLAKLTAAGVAFAGFTPDPRIGRIAAITVTRSNIITLALANSITLANGRSSKLVSLLPSGSIDESLFPPLPPSPPILIGLPTTTVAMACQADGKLLVLNQDYGGEVSTWTLGRLLQDHTVDPTFGTIFGNGGAPSRLLVIDDDSFFAGSQLYNPNGQPQANLDPAGYRWSFSPLCLMPDGAVIFQEPSNTDIQLRRWTKQGRDESFVAAVASRAAWSALGACPGPSGKLYVWGDMSGEVAPAASLVRLHRNGRIDATFRAPAFTQQDRRSAGPWQTYSAAGLVAFDPVANATTSLPGALWDAATNRLWVAGSFNTVSTAPRDGLAVLDGGSAPGYSAWSQAALRSMPGLAGPAMDPDGDGCSNQLEYATGADPLVPNPAACALQIIADEFLCFGLWRNPEAPEVYPVIKVSENLTKWRSATGAEVSLMASGNRLIFNLLPGAQSRFARVDFITP